MRVLLAALVGAALLFHPFFGAMPAGDGRAPGLIGLVETGTRPISGARVTLYLMGTNGSGASVLGRATSDASGRFAIPIGARIVGDTYVVAAGGSAGRGFNAAIALGALVSTPERKAANVVVNERSTVALAFALAQFSDASGTKIAAGARNYSGLNNAALLDRLRLVDASGRPAAFFPPGAACTGSGAPENCEGLERLNALADALAACSSSSGPTSQACIALLGAAGVPKGTTLAAAHAIALDPSRSASLIYRLSRSNDSYLPRPAASPGAWTLALKYYGNGKEFDGPGNFAIDAAGNIWITNNYTYAADQHTSVCGGKQVIELTPLGDDAAGAPFSGGGLDGAGFGITVDARGHVWVSNFGFAGKGCDPKPPGDSVSEFLANGKARSPKDGWHQGPIDKPQGTVTNLSGDVWFANWHDSTVTVYRNADPRRATTFYPALLRRPFGAAVDASNRLWITGEFSSNVMAIADDGNVVVVSRANAGIDRPLGVAIDLEGDAWVSNNGGNSVVVLDSVGRPALGSPIAGGGVRLPWGVAVDGNDNAWVGNFSGKDSRISEICGRRAICPRNLSPGQPISPSSGYASNLLQRVTGIAVDASGNVWACDNWQRIPYQTNPGGDGVVEFVGLAGPVRTPARGPVRRP